ncbi:MAG: PAS domain S-box protein [Candidatus Cloacimonetes bacterium]|nr:PAS domain S-box protein [Candidatus Cloacimonadota bacterium]
MTDPCVDDARECARVRSLSALLLKLALHPTFRAQEYHEFLRIVMQELAECFEASHATLWEREDFDSFCLCETVTYDRRSGEFYSGARARPVEDGIWVQSILSRSVVCSRRDRDVLDNILLSRGMSRMPEVFIDVALVYEDKILGIWTLEGKQGEINIKPEEKWFALSICELLSQTLNLQRLQKSNSVCHRVFNEHEIVLDFVPALIWYTNLEGRMLRANQAMFETSCLRPQEIQGRLMCEVLPSYWQRYGSDNEMVLKNGKPVLGQMEVLEIPSGGSVWLKVDKVPHRDSQGKIIGLFTFAVDVSSLKESQDALGRYNEELEGKVRERTVELATEIRERRRYEDALRESAEKYQQLFSTVSDPILVYELETRIITDVNEAAKRVYGYTRDEFLSMKLTELQGRDLSTNQELKLPDGFVPPAQGGFRIQRRKDGVCFPVIVAGGMFTLNGKAIGVAVIRDVTLELKSRFELQHARDLAEAATKAKSEFLANMSHEIRTPMNSILGFSDLLSHSDLPERERSWLAAISSSGKTLLALINDILDLSKIEAGRMDLNLEPVCLRNLIEDIRQMFLFKAEEKGIAIVVEIDPQLPSLLMLDEIRTRQILFNLLGNAVKFTDHGRICVSARVVHVSKSRLNLVLEIKDTGIGIPASEQQVIFEAFRQQSGQSSRRYGGTGLGLSITKRLVELMGGTVHLQSKPGIGSTFEIRLNDLEVLSTENWIDEPRQLVEGIKAVAEPWENLVPEGAPFPKHLPENVIQELTGPMLNRLNFILSTLVISEIEDFAVQLNHYGNQCQCPVLMNYSNKLVHAAKTFDIECLQKLLEQYPNMVGMVKHECT